MLCLELKPGENITIGDNIVLKLSRKRHKPCVICIEAPRDMQINRSDAKRKVPATPRELEQAKGAIERAEGRGK